MTTLIVHMYRYIVEMKEMYNMTYNVELDICAWPVMYICPVLHEKTKLLIHFIANKLITFCIWCLFTYILCGPSWSSECVGYWYMRTFLFIYYSPEVICGMHIIKILFAFFGNFNMSRIKPRWCYVATCRKRGLFDSYRGVWEDRKWDYMCRQMGEVGLLGP